MIVYRKKVSTQHNSAKQNEKRKTRCRLSLTDVVPAREGDCIHDIIAVDIVPQNIFPLTTPTTPSLVVRAGRPSAAALQSRHPPNTRSFRAVLDTRVLFVAPCLGKMIYVDLSKDHRIRLCRKPSKNACVLAHRPVAAGM